MKVNGRLSAARPPGFGYKTVMSRSDHIIPSSPSEADYLERELTAASGKGWDWSEAQAPIWLERARLAK